MKKALLSLLVLFAVALTLSSCTCQHNDPTEIVILEAKDPTCQKEGLTEGMKCNLCGVMVVPPVAIPKLECTPGDWIVDKEATKTEDGARHTSCIVCGEKVDEILYATGSVGLAYRVRSDGKSCEITGMGTCADKEMVIPAYIDGYRVNLIGGGVFSSCTSIEVVEKNVYYKSIDGNLYTEDEQTLVQYATGKKDESFVVPDTVTRIEAYAFFACKALTSIIIPDGVTSIGAEAFRHCSSLTSIVIPNGVQEISGWTFNDCTSLTYVYIPDSVTAIEGLAFAGCSSLANITIPDSVASIGNLAFEHTSLASINIPTSVTSIGFGAFRDCSLFDSFIYDGTIEQWNAIEKSDYWDNTMGNYTVYCSDGQINRDCSHNNLIYTIILEAKNATCQENGVTQGKKCGYCDAVLVPQEIVPTIACIESGWIVDIAATKVEDGLRHTECTMCGKRIKEEAIPATGSVGLEYKINSDKKSCTITGIGTCTDTKIAIPPEINGYKVTEIGNRAFDYCRSIISITIPNTVTTIGAYAFDSCTALTSVDIPDSMTRIGDHAFECCSSLENITIPESVTVISGGMFGNCSSLVSITIPETVTSIEAVAFFNCTSLANINIPDSITYIGYEVFSGCSSLVSITIPDSVTTIDDWAFSGCGFVSITIPDSVTSIGSYAFSSCSSLTSITLPSSVTSVGWYVFWHCTALENVIIESASSLGEGVFLGCSSLTSIYIPSTVTWIWPWAFRDCTSLDSFYFGDTVAQWNNIRLNNEWDINTGSYTIYCTDGEIAKDGTVTYY